MRFLAPRYATSPVVPMKEVTTALEKRPIVDSSTVANLIVIQPRDENFVNLVLCECPCQDVGRLTR